MTTRSEATTAARPLDRNVMRLAALFVQPSGCYSGLPDVDAWPLGKAAARAIATARHERPGEFFRIVRYERQRGRAGREIPIYSHAGGTDAPRPDLSSREHVRARQARYYQANRTLVLERFRARRGKPINPWGGLMPAERRAT